MTGPSDTELVPDPEIAEEYAEEVGPDPTQEQINQYQRLEGEPTVEDEAADLEDPPLS